VNLKITWSPHGKVPCCNSKIKTKEL